MSDHHSHRTFTFLLIAVSTSTLHWIIYKQTGSDIIIIVKQHYVIVSGIFITIDRFNSFPQELSQTNRCNPATAGEVL